MKRQPGETWTCECGEQLIGALTKNGNVAPITIKDYDDGNCWLGRRSTPEGPLPSEIRTATFAGETLAKVREAGMSLHRNHFHGCPSAEKFRG